MIADKGDRGRAVDRTEKRMFENDLTQARAIVCGAQRLQASARRIKVFDRLFLRWWIQRLYALWGFHAEQARSDDPCWYQTPDHGQALRRLRERVLQGVDDVLFNQREVMNNLGHAPFVVRWPALEMSVIHLVSQIEQFAMYGIEFGECPIQLNSQEKA